MAILLRGADVTQIHDMKRQGLSLKRISALTGYDRKTIRKYLANPKTPEYGPRKRRPSILDGWQDFIEKQLLAGIWNGVVVHRKMREQGFTGSYTAVKDYLTPLRKEAARVACRRFETPPGQQAQVDWGTLGHIERTEDRKAEDRKAVSGFVLTLGSSRAMFAAVARDQTLSTLIRMHEEAFTMLGGVPREILYDNMKTVMQGRDDRDEVQWNETFLDFTRYWGFEPRLCRPRRPQTKGKVENGIGYVRKNFLCATTARTPDELDTELRRWVTDVANRRVHGTTHRQVSEALQEERRYLLPVAGRPPFPFVSQEMRRAGIDAYVCFRTNRYSVPWQAAGKEVKVRLCGLQLRIERDGEQLASHPLCTGRFQTLTQPGHLVGMPFGLGNGNNGKRKIQVTLVEQAPAVEIRDLSAYEAIAGEALVGAGSTSGRAA